MSLRRSSRLLAAATSLPSIRTAAGTSTTRAVSPPAVQAVEASARRTAKRARSSQATAPPIAEKELDALIEASARPSKRRKKKVIEYNLQDFPVRVQNGWKVGPHVSAAGGVENAILNAASIGANAFGIFLKSQRKWTSNPLTPESISTFKSRMKEFGYSPSHILPHGSYLVNLGNPDADKREKSYECFLDDLQRCEQLGLLLYNFHPGSSLGLCSSESCISWIAQCINRAHKATNTVTVVLENMAGTGNVMGSKFAELGGIIKEVDDKSRVGVCLDTCHMYAAGYDITTKDGWEAIMDDFDREVGAKYLRGMHLNDSKMGLGSKRDRHENIGIGHLTLHTFAHILCDPRTKNIPLILETPAFEVSGAKPMEGMDVWKKEIQILNKLSALPAQSGDGCSSHSKESLVEWLEEIRTAVSLASDKQAARKAKKVEGGSRRAGKGRQKVEDEAEEDAEDEGGSCCDHEEQD